MRRIPFAVAAILVLAACRGEAPVETRPIAASHEAMVAGMAGNFVWDCTMQAEDGTAPWRFVLQRRTPEIYKVEAGRAVSELVKVRKRGAARIYTMKDKGEVLIAADGEAFGSGPSRARAPDYPSGECTRGTG